MQVLRILAGVVLSLSLLIANSSFAYCGDGAVVRASQDLAEPFDQYTGADIEAALQTCHASGGCLLDLDGAIYDDVMLQIHAINYPNGFPNGLSVRAVPGVTTLRSPVPAHPITHYNVPINAVVYIETSLNLFPGEDTCFQWFNTIFDGRKQDQPHGLDYTWHTAIFTRSVQAKHFENAHFEGNIAVDFVTNGYTFNYLKNARFVKNKAYRIGCWENDLTGSWFGQNVVSPQEMKCHSSWQAAPDDMPSQVGNKNESRAITTSNAINTRFDQNEVRWSYIGIQSYNDTGTNVFNHNLVEDTSVPMICHQGCQTDFLHNMISRAGTTLPGTTLEAGSGFAIQANGSGNMRVEHNIMEDMLGHGIYLKYGTDNLNINFNSVSRACQGFASQGNPFGGGAAVYISGNHTNFTGLGNTVLNNEDCTYSTRIVGPSSVQGQLGTN